MQLRPLSPLLRWLKDNDPCYVELARVVHIGIGLTLAIAIGIAANQALGLGQALAFPMFVALGTSTHLSFIAASSRMGELRDLARISVLTLGFILLTTVIGPGSLPEGPVMMKVLLVPTTFVALYMRRYGPEYHRAGLALFITAMIAGLIEPSREQGWWLLLAASVGAALAYLLRLAPLRPSAARGLAALLADYRRVLIDVLTTLARELATEAAITRELRGVVPRLRRRVRAAAIAATAELPQRQAEFDVVRADVYRLQLAVAFLLEAAPNPLSPDPTARAIAAQLVTVVTAVRERIAMGPWPGVAEDDVHTALARLVETVMEAPLAGELQRYDLLRCAAALERVLAATVELDAILHHTAPLPPTIVPPEPQQQPGMRPTTRVACQGLAASAVTTALDLGLGLSHAYWATLTVMLVIGSSFGETALRARHRTMGTCLGAGLGIVVAVLLQGAPWTLTGLCILGQMLGALTAQRRFAVSAAAIGFSVVVGLHLLGGLGAGDMLARIYETAIGAGVALLASRLVLPVYGGDQARQQIRAILARCRAACAAWWPPQPAAATPESANQLVRELILLEERLPQLNTEAVLGQRSAAEVVRLSTFLRVLQTYLVLVEQAAARLAEADDLGTAEAVLAEFRSELLAAFDEPGSDVARLHASEERLMTRRAAEGMAELRQRAGSRSAVLALVEYTFYGEALARALHGLGEAVAGRAPADQVHAKD